MREDPSAPAPQAHRTVIETDSPPVIRYGTLDGLKYLFLRHAAGAQLTKAHFRILLLLLDHVNVARFKNEGRLFAWPSVRTIRRVALLGRATIYRSIEQLESMHLLRRVPGTGRTTTEYELLVPDPDEGARGLTSETPGARATRPQGSHQRDSSLNIEIELNDDDGKRDVVVGLLRGETFEEEDAQYLATLPNYTEERVTRALAVLRATKSKGVKIPNPRGYVRRLIERGASPVSAEERRAAAQPEHAQEDLAQQRQRVAAQEAQERAEREAITRIPRDQLRELVTAAIDSATHDAVRTVWLKHAHDPAALPTLRGEVLKRLQGAN